MTHGDKAGTVCCLKIATLLVALSPELLFLGAGVQLRDNGYDGLLIAINPQVSEDQNLIPNIKEMVTEASFYLFNATKRRVFFRNTKILIPATWKANNYSKVKQESYEKVVEFCNASTHNQEAPNRQNQMCSLRSTWDVISDSTDFHHSSPMNGTELPPPPTFSLVQAGDKVVCLVLDVSSKMAEADRLLRLEQAAEFYLMQIVESHTFVGIVSFNSNGEIRAQLHQINNDDDRKLLVSHLPATVSADPETSICSGLKRGFEVAEKLNGKAYGSVLILVTSGHDEHISNCLLTVLSSGSTIHTIALGASVDKNLEELSHLTAPLDSEKKPHLTSFKSSGPSTEYGIELESMGENVKPHHQLKSTVTVDNSMGNDTTFLVTWQTSGPPDIELFEPNGRKYYTHNFTINQALRTARLWIPGTAQPGPWTYALNNTHHSLQSLKVTVTSRASHSAQPPATVEAFVEKDSTSFPHPVMIYANVRKGFYPILNATVTATIEPETEEPVTLKLLDDGAGNIQMNVPRKSLGRSEEEQKWGFSRTSSGGSFSVLGVPTGPHPDTLPPCRIIDLEAVQVEEEVTLSWTAPGEDFDQGQVVTHCILNKKRRADRKENGIELL
ncbi:Calcium-activated chloride channel regulator 2 [Myotis brandtii]|uniref:Calcium-activated chloride channel regulator 2 n=1 Tax=Myotis brandtii TaxID=109478 RepID=S7QEV6_MYOBR|nr:Calcium-activated chloride channel regulator 2 [Myotis brandtii]